MIPLGLQLVAISAAESESNTAADWLIFDFIGFRRVGMLVIRGLLFAIVVAHEFKDFTGFRLSNVLVGHSHEA